MQILLFLAFTACIASCIGIISGFGVGTIMTPLVLLILPLSQTLFLVGIIHLMNSIGKVVLFKNYIVWDLVFKSGIPAIITSFIGALLVGYMPNIMIKVLGIFFIIYSFFIVYKPTFYIPPTNSFKLLGGSVYGFLAGISGIRGAVGAMFFSALNLRKESYLGTVGVIGCAVDMIRLPMYWYYGVHVDYDFMSKIGITLISAFIGIYMGKYLTDKISQRHFRYVIALFLLLMGLRLLILPSM